MNLRVSTILGFLVCAALAFGLYLVKYAVQDVQNDLASRRAELASEREAIHLLNAEWAYLTRPERLEELQQKHLSLQTISSVQTVPVSAIRAGDVEGDAPIIHDVVLSPAVAGAR